MGYCNQCSKKIDEDYKPDIDIYKLFDTINKCQILHVNCDGCYMTGIYKTASNKSFISYVKDSISIEQWESE